jgi:tetratricopeptide (TPR) repeat protein
MIRTTLALCLGGLLLLGGCTTSGDTPSSDRVVGESTGDIDLMRDTARFYWDKGEYDRAAAQYEAVLDRERDDPEATLGLGMCYAQLGARDESYFGKGTDLLRKYQDSMARTGDVRALNALGMLFFKQGTTTARKIDEAERERTRLEQQISSLGERLAASTSRSERRRVRKELTRWQDSLVEQEGILEGLRDDKDQQLAQATRYLTQAIEGNPTDDLGYKLRSEVNSLRGPAYYNDAILDIDMYLDLKVYSSRERLEAAMGKTPEEELLEAPEERRDPRNTAAYLAAVERLDRLEAVLDLAPQRTTAYAEIARAYEEAGRYEDAISSYEHYIDALPVAEVEEKARIRMRIKDLQTQVTPSVGE